MSIPLPVRFKLFMDYTKRADSGDPEAAFQVAVCHGRGFGVRKDKTKMLEWCIRAAELGSLDAMINLALQFEFDDINRDQTQVFSWFLDAAEDGHRIAQEKVALCY